MGTQHYPITGIATGNPNNPPPRREISDWYAAGLKDEKSEAGLQVSLFIQALSWFQRKNPKEAGNVNAKLSYYRIASIHGSPVNVPWDGVGHDKVNEAETWFCSHGTATFPTWHRPYLALYEQTIYNNMKEIITAFPEEKWATSPSKAQWQAAADSWRLPYWDYATKPAIPQIAATPDISVLGFDGKRVQYGEGVKFQVNPMYTFQPKVIGYQNFGDLPEKLSLPAPWKTPIGTSRQPQTPADFNAGISNIPKVGVALDKPDWTNVGGPKSAGAIREVVSRLINDTYFNSYSKFASTRYRRSRDASLEPRPRDWLSLENLHNAIHGFVGGEGQMSDPSVAAFDPIFWVHHCFIDMIFHSWQVNTKYAYFFNDPIDDTPGEKASTWLKPFHGASDSEIRSSTVKETKALNYTYDRIIEKKSTDGAIDRSVRLGVRKMVNEHFNMTRTEVTNILPDRKTDNDLIINVAYSRFDLNNGEPYWIHFFVGDVGEPEHYLNNPNLVGSVYNFSAPIDHSGCQNCQEQLDAGDLATGQVPITGAVLKDWVNVAVPGLPASGPFNEATVSAYLRDHFQWRVVRTNGEPVPIESLPNLKVIVLLGDADHHQDLEVSSTFTNYKPLWDATNTKVGGGRVGDHYG